MADDPLSPAEEFRAIVQGDFCSGCGACAHVSKGRIPLNFEPTGRYLPSLEAATPEDLAAAAQVCPFSAQGPDEDAIAERLFPALPRHPAIGRHAECHVGHVVRPSFRTNGSSGGLTNWVAARLLQKGAVSGVLHVRPAAPAQEGTLFRFALSRSVEELARGAKSHYYPVEMSQVLSRILDRPGERYAVIALPCFLKALHRLMLQDDRLAAAIGPTIGLVCGHLKTAAFAELLAWQVGIPPRELAAIDFRHKLLDRPASAYAMAATAADGAQQVRPMAELAGRDWGQGWFRLNACSYCDDVVSETADISIGDAWLPGWVEDSAGTNVVALRSETMRELIAEGLSEGELRLQPLSAEEFAQSQAGGLRYRRDGLALRLAQAQAQGRWVPRKRVRPARRLGRQRERQLAVRERMAQLSREAGAEARASGDFAPLLEQMAALIREDQRLAHPTLVQRLKRTLKRLLGRFL